MSTTSSSTPVVWSEKHQKTECENGSVTVVTFDNSKTTRLTIKRKDGPETSIRLTEDQMESFLKTLGVELDGE